MTDKYITKTQKLKIEIQRLTQIIHESDDSIMKLANQITTLESQVNEWKDHFSRAYHAGLRNDR
jgi:predicted RNase H-like nuclease (RuvC/YqgF family)